MVLEQYLAMFGDDYRERMEQDKEALMGAYYAQADVHSRKMLSCFEELFRKCEKVQTEGKKDAVSFLCVHPLRTSVRMKNYEYLIALYDKSFYFDRQEVSTYWGPSYFYEIAENTIQYFTKLIRKQCIRVPDCEIEQFSENYLFSLMKQQPCEIQDMIGQVKDLEEIHKIIVSPDYGFYMGEYRESVSRIKIVDQAE